MNALHPPGWNRRSATSLLSQPGARGVLISASRDPDAKLMFVVTSGGRRLAVKVPATVTAGAAVDHEGRMLVEVRRLGLGALAPTVPRYVESLDVEGRPVLVSTALPGTPMSVGYHRWGHTARESAVRADLAAAFGWLRSFQAVTARRRASVSWPGEVLDTVRGRWDGHPDLPAAAVRLQAAADALDGCTTASTAVHGDFWCGNVLLVGSRVSGVVDWEAASPQGSPLRDPARFLLSYSLYLDRHTRPGAAVRGHRGLRREGFAPGVVHALCGSGWYPDLVRHSLGDALGAAGVDPGLWYEVALTGIGEVAASANSDDFGAGHLTLLAGMPLRPRRHRG